MQDDKPQLSVGPAGDKGALMILPCPPEEFADFITGLLGKPQIIDRDFIGPINISYNDVVSLYSLIHHRIAEQNQGQMLQFSATFSYNDRSSVTVTSFEDFKTYAEVKNVETLSLTCSFEYLIKFAGSGHPEKQAIDVTFRRPDMRRVLRAQDKLAQRLLWPDMPTIVLRIKHTARSWGADIEALLSSHISGLIRTERPVREFLLRYANPLGWLAGFATVGSGALAAPSLNAYLKRDFDAENRAILAKIHDAASASEYGIPFIIKESAAKWNEKAEAWTVLAAIVTLIFAVLVGIIVAAALSKEYPTFLTFTKADERRKPKLIATYEKGIWWIVGSGIAALLYGVLGNYIFAYLTAH